MFELIPAIFIFERQCAILQADGKIVIFDKIPLEVSMEFEDAGFKRVHVVDLDGAKKEKLVNHQIIEVIKGHTKLSIDFGGGINDDDDMRIAFESGASMVHIAGLPARDRQLFGSWLVTYGNKKIMLGADSYNGKLVTKGWQHKTEIDLLEYIEHFYDRGIKYIKCSEVIADGNKEPSFEMYKMLIEKFPDLKIISAGGISSIDHIKKLQDIGVYGAIFGKAYYEEKIKLKDLSQFLF